MSKSVETIACPVCRTELSLEQITGHLDDERAFARLVALTVPMARSVVQYLGLFTPPRQILTLRKKVRLIQQLLPDLSRCAITHRGRDWAAPPAAWEQAIEQMLAARDAGRLDLPMKSHAYLYTILMGLADKVEGAAESQALAERQQAARSGAPAVIASEARQSSAHHIDPALAKIALDATQAAPMPQAVREKIAALRGGKPAQPNTEDPTP